MNLPNLLFPLIGAILFTILLHLLPEPIQWNCEDIEYHYRARKNIATVCVSKADTIVYNGTSDSTFKEKLIQEATK